MIIPIYVPGSVSASINGEVWKAARCEKCSCDYVYSMLRTAAGSETVWLGSATAAQKQRAVNHAQANLHYTLQRDVDPAPCPQCGWYQRQMVEAMRERLYPSGLQIDSIVAGIVGICSLTVAALAVAEMGRARPGAIADALLPSVVLGVVAFGLCWFFFAWRRRQRRRFDPNLKPPKRKFDVGRIMLRSKFDEIVAEQGQMRPPPPRPAVKSPPLTR